MPYKRPWPTNLLSMIVYLYRHYATEAKNKKNVHSKQKNNSSIHQLIISILYSNNYGLKYRSN